MASRSELVDSIEANLLAPRTEHHSAPPCLLQLWISSGIDHLRLHLKQVQALGIAHVTPSLREEADRGLHTRRFEIAEFACHNSAATCQRSCRNPQIIASASQSGRPGVRMFLNEYGPQAPRGQRNVRMQLAMRHLPCQNWRKSRRRPAHSEPHGSPNQDVWIHAR